MLISILLIACVVSASFVALRLVTSSVAEHQTIYVEPSYVQVVPCTNFTVNVRIRNVVDLYGWQFNMSFDPTVMQCLSVTEGPFLSSNGTKPTIFLGPIINNTDGWILVGCTLLVPPGTSGGCVLAYVTFHCTALGNSSLVLHDTMLINSAGAPISHNVENGFVEQARSLTYMYKVKFECGWQNVTIQPCTPCNISQRITVETLTRTQVNVYNPNDFAVNVTKYFVLILPEDREFIPIGPCNVWTPFPGGGRTCHIHIIVPERKGFEIDCDDVRKWSQFPDPDNPIPLLNCSWPFFKGFVIIECTLPPWALPLEVVAVYNKESADMVDKITFHLNFTLPPVDTLLGKLKVYEPYEISAKIPFEPANLTVCEEVGQLLGWTIPFEDEPWIGVVETNTYFDFLECVAKERIVFTMRPTNLLVEKFLNQTWPVEMRPPGFVWPDWIWPCKIYEMKIEEKFCKPWQEVIVDPEANIRDYMTTTLINLGVPENITRSIMSAIGIKILDIDVGKGVGTSIDVEYIKPEIIIPLG